MTRENKTNNNSGSILISMIEQKTNYAENILSKFTNINYSKDNINISELFFMLTYLQTKYLYDIGINIKNKKTKLIHKQSCTSLTIILHQLKESYTNFDIDNCKRINKLFSNWIFEQQEIDSVLIKSK